MNLVRFCREHSRAVFLLTAFLTIAGVAALFELPSNIYPELSFPRVVVLVKAGDLDPDTMLVSVTRPLEEQVSSVLGVRRVRSRTIRGGSEISVIFGDGSDMQAALQAVQARVSEARSSLPADAEVEVERFTPTVWPILSVILNGNVPETDLRDQAYYYLRPVLSRIPGVARVEIESSVEREVSVIVDPAKALAYRISVPEIAERLRATNEVTTAGRLDQNSKQYLVLATGRYQDLEQVRNTVIATAGAAPVRLRDVAEVVEGATDRRMIVSGNGQPAALINVTRQIGGDILGIAGQARAVLAHPRGIISPGLKLTLVYDLAQFVREAMASVGEAILIGSLLAVFVLFVFLRELRTTLIAAITLPLTVAGSFFVMKMLGGTLNLMSLGGLAIAIGLVIDDAVVVVENIYRHIGLGATAAEAAEKGTQELIGPVLGSTITTVVVFLPLGLLEGVVGDFFSALSLTLASAVLLSLLYAVTLIPLLSMRCLDAERFRKSSSAFMDPVNQAYERALRWALNRRGVVCGAVSLSAALAVAMFYQLGTGFLPEMDEGGYVLDYLTEPGTSLTQTDVLVKDIEGRIKKMDETAAFSRRTGAELGLFATEQNKGDILVKLKPRSERKRDIEEIMSDLRADINKDLTGIDVEFVQILQDMIGDLEGAPEPIEVKIFGNDTKELARIAGEVGPKIEKIKGVVDFKGVQQGNPEMVLHIDPVRAGHLGLTVAQVSDQLQGGLLGVRATEFREADRIYGIRARFGDKFRFDPEKVRDFPILTANRQVVPLSAIADIETVQGANRLLRENQRLLVTLTARLEGRDLGSAAEDVKKVLAGTKLPVGYTFEIGGQYETQQRSFRDLLYVLFLAIAAVFVVLVIQFRSFVPSLIILSAAPLSMFGVFLMLLVTRTSLNVSSFMGIVLMVGLVVKNGIIFFEYFFHARREGKLDLYEALVQAGHIRIRPILMTTLCTLFGLLPLALGLGSGAELQRPLALAVIGGLSVSTFITLLVMPVFYSLLTKE